MSEAAKTNNYIIFPAVLWFIVVTPTLVYGKNEILLDTRRALSDLGWTMSAGSEWQEMTSSDPSGNEQRMLMVCEIKKSNQNNWMRSQYINVRGAKRVYVEIKFTIRSCEDVEDVATCKETFNLFYYETDRDEATSTFPPWDENTYTKVDTIAADKRFRPGSSNLNFETRDIGPLSKNGIYLAVQDTGGCVALMYVRVYYKYCDKNTTNLAIFEKTTTGEDVTSLVEAKGSCVRNAVGESNITSPSLYCNGEGKWTVPSGSCICIAGYQPNKQKTHCLACPAGEYKSNVANQPCQRCPDYSRSDKKGASRCECMNGYFRASSDSASDHCTKPPSKPVNLSSKVNETSVTLIWTPPLNAGGREDFSYEVLCYICEEKFTTCKECGPQVKYSSNRRQLTATKIVLASLSAYSFYKLKVCAVNGVTKKAREAGKLLNNCGESTIETDEAAPSVVVGIQATKITGHGFFLTWKKPTKPNGRILDYEISVSLVASMSLSGKQTTSGTNRLNRTTQQKINITGLESGENYLIKIRARTVAGYGPYCTPIGVKTRGMSETPKNNDKDEMAVPYKISTLHLILITCGSLLFFLVLIVGTIYCRRRQAKKVEKKKRNQKKTGAIFNGNSVLFNSTFLSPHKTYVDPTTYEDPHRAVRDFTKELDSSFVKLEDVIGGGEFGEVCKGKLQLPNRPEQDIAIKTLKIGYSPQQKLDFLGEASIMGQFNHPNVIHLEGVVTKSRPLMIITEYMKNGSLDSFLRNHDNQLSVVQLVGMLRNISEGMKYLSEMGYVHRDLAARNILVNSQLVCKVSDFGMSRVLENDEDAAYTTRGGKIPIRWTAPEAITFRKFTSASDVWSFGIVMWEVMSYGERPYWGMSNQDVMNAIENGYRLPAPMDCPQVQHKLMLDCWKKDRNQRPKFDQIVTSLDNMLKEPAQLKIIVTNRRNPKAPTSNIIPAGPSSALPVTFGKVPSKETRLPFAAIQNRTNSPLLNPEVNEKSPMLLFSERENNVLDSSNNHITESLETWLERQGLSQYRENFLRHGYTKLEQIVNLNSNDLRNLGIVEAQHLELLLSSFHSFRQVFAEQESRLPTYTESNLSYSGIPV